MYRSLLILGLWLSAWGQSPLAPPLAGWIRDDGCLRPVYGITGNFLTGDAVRDGILSAGFSGTTGAVKTDSKLIVIDSQGQPVRTLSAPSGPALLAFDRLAQPAWVYYPETQQMQNLSSDNEIVDLSQLRGKVLAVGAAVDQARFVVARDAGLWLVALSATGQVVAEESLAGLPVDGPVILLHDGTLIVADGSTLIVRQPMSEDRRLALPAPAQDLELSGDSWIRVGQPDGVPSLVLHLSKDERLLFRLPAGARP